MANTFAIKSWPTEDKITSQKYLPVSVAQDVCKRIRKAKEWSKRGRKKCLQYASNHDRRNATSFPDKRKSLGLESVHTEGKRFRVNRVIVRWISK